MRNRLDTTKLFIVLPHIIKAAVTLLRVYKVVEPLIMFCMLKVFFILY